MVVSDKMGYFAPQKKEMLTFIKNWSLPIAIIFGSLGYLAFANFSFLEPTKPIMNWLVIILTPSLIFFQLLLTFCKVEPKELTPKKWHLWLSLIQLLACLVLASVLLFCPVSNYNKVIIEGAMVCIICPTATAAAVITGKLGGSASSLTTYTLLSNFIAAIIVPAIFPLVENSADSSFITAFFSILSKVFPLLLCPFIVAMFLRYFCSNLHKIVSRFHGMAFYLWAVSLTIVSAQTMRSLIKSDAPVSVQLSIAIVGLLVCCLQFLFGKTIGTKYNDRVSAGQALGQKNTVLAIWMACTYLNPLSSVGPGSYVVWQNIINSYQLWKNRKKELKNKI